MGISFILGLSRAKLRGSLLIDLLQKSELSLKQTQHSLRLLPFLKRHH